MKLVTYGIDTWNEINESWFHDEEFYSVPRRNDDSRRQETILLSFTSDDMEIKWCTWFPQEENLIKSRRLKK